jgi:hypothetical protein
MELESVKLPREREREREFFVEILGDRNARNSRVKFLFLLVFDFTFIPFVFCKTVWVFWGLI